MQLKPLPGIILSVLIAALPLFSHLDQLPMQLYDEARVAVKALEMSQNGNWLVTMVNHAPDMWSVKPPMAVWIQALFIKMFGMNELAVRLPSALAGLATCLMIVWFFVKRSKDAWPGVIATIMLCTSMGFVTLHGTRTADFDAILTIFTTAYLLYFYLYLEEEETKYLHLTFIMLIFSAYTKGIQGLMFLPALLMYAAYRKKMGMIFRQKYFYLWVVAFLVIVPGYYFLREHYNPGYLKAVWVNELGVRYSTVVESHAGPWYYFIDWIKERAFTHWYPALIGGIISIWLVKDKEQKHILIYNLLAIIVYMFVISSAQTKCWWYIMPVVPLMAIIAATFIDIMVKILFNYTAWQPYVAVNILPYAFLIIIAIRPYSDILDVTMGPPPGYLWSYLYEDMAEVLQSEVRDKHQVNMNDAVVPNTFYLDNLLWYREILEIKHRNIRFADDMNLGENVTVFVHDPNTKKYIEDSCRAVLMGNCKSVNVYKVYGKK